MENEKTIKGFKGFNKGLECRGKIYSENEVFEEKVEPKTCDKGMHFCRMPLDVFKFYPPKVGAEYAEVEAIGETAEESDKVATNKLKINSKISVAGLFKAHFDIIRETVKKATKESRTRTATNSNEHASASGYEGHASASGNYGHASASGYKGHASASGDEGHASASGNYGHASASGYKGHASASGNHGHASASGYKGHASASGNYGHASASGNYGHASASGDEGHASASGNHGHASASGYEGHASASGYYGHASASGNYGHASASGDESIACSLGVYSKSRASKGWIVIVDWRQDDDYNWFIHNIYRAKVGKHKIAGIRIEPDTSYWFENGELKSEK